MENESRGWEGIMRARNGEVERIRVRDGKWRMRARDGGKRDGWGSEE